MRAFALVAACPLFAGCTATMFYEPRFLISPYLAIEELRGSVAVQSRPGGGALQDNAGQSLDRFGQGHHEEDVGIRADIGDGFGGVRIDYLRLDMSTTDSGELGADWGNLQATDAVRMQVQMDELRLGYLEPLLDAKLHWRERPIDLRLAAGGMLAHRSLDLQATTVGGARSQNVEVSGDVAYAAVRGRATLQNWSLDLEYALSPDLALGGEFGDFQQDLEARLSYTLPLRDLTFFAGYRYSDLAASGHQGGYAYDADLVLDGFQFGLVLAF